MSAIKRIKVLHAIRQGKVGGGETHVLDLVNNLDKDKYESVILSFTDGPMVEQLNAGGFKTYVVSTEKPFNFRVWGDVKKILKSEKIDIVHAHGTRACSNTFSSARNLKIPVIYTVHGWSFHPDQGKVLKTMRILSERFLVSKVNTTVCVSEGNLKEGKRNFPMPRGIVVNYGINQVKFNPNNTYSDIRKEFGIGQDEVLISYIVRITIQKDPLVYIQAIANIKDKTNLKFLIVGDGDLKPKMLALAEELKLSPWVIFVGFRTDIPALLKATNVFCLPSLWEGLPIGLLEAMAMHKAIVATSIDGTTDVITDSENGFLVPPSNPAKLANAIEKLSSNKALQLSFGEKCGQLIDEKFNISIMVKNIEEQYLKLLPVQ